MMTNLTEAPTLQDLQVRNERLVAQSRGSPTSFMPMSMIPRAPNALSENQFAKEKYVPVVLKPKFEFEQAPIVVYIQTITKKSQQLNNFRVSQQRLMVDCIDNLGETIYGRMWQKDALNFTMEKFEHTLIQMCPVHLRIDPAVHRSNVESNRCKDAKSLPDHMMKIESTYLALADRKIGDPVPLTTMEYMHTVGHHRDALGVPFGLKLIHQIRDGILRTLPYDLRPFLFGVQGQIMGHVNSLEDLEQMYEQLNVLVQSTLPIKSSAKSLWSFSTVDGSSDSPPTPPTLIVPGGDQKVKGDKKKSKHDKDKDYQALQEKRKKAVSNNDPPSKLGDTECQTCVDRCTTSGVAACNCSDFDHYNANCPHAIMWADRKDLKCSTCDGTGHEAGSIRCIKRKQDRKKAVPGKRLQ